MLAVASPVYLIYKGSLSKIFLYVGVNHPPHRDFDSNFWPFFAIFGKKSRFWIHFICNPRHIFSSCHQMDSFQESMSWNDHFWPKKCHFLPFFQFFGTFLKIPGTPPGKVKKTPRHSRLDFPEVYGFLAYFWGFWGFWPIFAIFAHFCSFWLIFLYNAL